jgi:hypothetical protein
MRIRSAASMRISVVAAAKRCGAGAFITASSFLCKATVLSQGGGIARAVQNADDHDRALVTDIVDRVITRKTHAQAGRKVVARWRGKRKIPQRFAILFDAVDQARRGRLGGFASDIEPNFSEVGFGLLS